MQADLALRAAFQRKTFMSRGTISGKFIHTGAIAEFVDRYARACTRVSPRRRVGPLPRQFYIRSHPLLVKSLNVEGVPLLPPPSPPLGKLPSYFHFVGCKKRRTKACKSQLKCPRAVSVRTVQYIQGRRFLTCDVLFFGTSRIRVVEIELRMEETRLSVSREVLSDRIEQQRGNLEKTTRHLALHGA